ncbi:ankyrin repeat domain-containing protein [Brachyspira innocens]|uniref:ankyrin repeat domain-containing protein n=1 Tax=Brachyspira innocens TaxID=13264 RepID=UPI00047844D1|nr:ankyrin repeat domain-containing protein [Brachyspira innocens]
MLKKYIVLIIIGVIFMGNNSYGISQDENIFLNACRYGQVYRIKELIDKVNINVQDEEEGYTPLMNAIRGRKIEAVKILLEHNADVTKIKDNSGRNAFFWAAALDELEMLKLFEKYNPDFNTVDNAGSTVLFYTGEHETIDYLLKNGTDINKKNKSGRTPLIQHSLAYEAQDLVKFLIENGADVNAQDNEGITTLMFAVKDYNIEIVNMCLSANANLHIKDKEGKTALFYTLLYFYAIDYGKNMTYNMFGKINTEITELITGNRKKEQEEATKNVIKFVKLLIDNGADINSQDNKGNTLLMYAITFKYKPLVDEILKLNPDVNIKNKEGKTANDIASMYGYKIVK